AGLRAGGAAQPAGEASLGRELQARAFGIGQPEAVRAVVGEEAPDRIALAAAGDPAHDVERAGAELERERAPAAGARELVQEAAAATRRHALRPPRAASAAAGAIASAPDAGSGAASARALAAASRPARRPVSSATPSPVRSRAGSKPPSRSPA